MNKWLKAAWTRETRKEQNAIMSLAIEIMEDTGIAVLFPEDCISIEGR